MRARVLAASALAAILGGGAALAGEPRQTGGGIVLPNAPADSGKPMIFNPPPPAVTQSEPDTCPPTLPCGARLIGTVQKNGAVEVQVPVWRW